MNQNLNFNEHGRIRTLWRILIFTFTTLLLISPLLLINNSIIQFLGANLILIGALYLNSKYLDKQDFEVYGLIFKKVTIIDLVVGFIVGFLSVVSILLIGAWSNFLVISKSEMHLDVAMQLLFALKMLLVGSCEEVFFRGYLFTTIYIGLKSKETSGKNAIVIALLISSVVFGLAHLSNNHASLISTLLLTINGMVWCIPLIITRNLGLSIGMHTAWNFTQTQLGFTMSGNKAIDSFYKIENVGPDYQTGGAYGPEAGVLGLIGFSIMLLLTLSYVKFRDNIFATKFTNYRLWF